MAKFDTLMAQLSTEVFAVEPNFASSLLDNLKSFREGTAGTHTEIANDSVTYQVLGDKAIIALDGAMYKKNIGMCENVVSYDQIVARIDEAEANDNVNSIIFRVDTRGGSVAGADEVRERIANSPKKTITFFENIGASGGMWIFTASDEVYATENTVLGSIGVIVMYQESEEKVLSIVSSNAPNKHCDIADEGCKKRIQSNLDEYESMFLDRLTSAYPSKSKEQIISDFDHGAVIFAKEAHKLGYLNGVTSFKSLLDDTLATMPSSEKIATNHPQGEINNEGIDVKTAEALQAELDTANATIEANQTQIDGQDEKIQALTAKSDNSVSMGFIKETLAMGNQFEASNETLVAMIESGESTKAENIALKAQNESMKDSNSNGAIIDAGHQATEDATEAHAVSKEEIQEALNGN